MRSLPLLTRAPLLLFLSFGLALCLLVSSSSREAVAATANGGSTLDTGRRMTLTCEVANCSTGILPVLDCYSLGCPNSPPWKLHRSAVDPLSWCIPAGVQCHNPNPPAPDWTHPSEAGTGTGTTIYWGPAGAMIQGSGTGRYIYATIAADGTVYVMGVWDLGAAPATPTTSPPTTSPSPTSPPATGTTTPPADGTTTPPPSGSGSVCGTTTETACFVKVLEAPPAQIDASGMTVDALSDEQWGELLLALGALTFFSAASFVSGWRRGRRG